MEGGANCDKNPMFWGESLPTQSVQALAASEDLTEIPHRYIRPNVEEDFLGVVSDEEIPIIDLTRLLDTASSDDEAAKLKLACEEWGFFQLINHGVPTEVIERMKTDVEVFFGLPLEEKKAYALVPGCLEGYGQGFVISEGQKLDWADSLTLATQPINLRNMRFWPTQPPTFRDTLDKYTEGLNKVADCLLRFMAENLGLQSDELINLYESGIKSMRINYYPPCPQANKVLGISPHSDMTGLTLLLQFSEVQGLQIKRHGRWIPIKPIPGTFTVNIGDVLEIMTNGRYKSIEHRAVVNPNEKRISVALFYDPNVDSMVGPLPKLAQGRENYKTLSYESYSRMVVSTTIDGNTLAQMKIQK